MYVIETKTYPNSWRIAPGPNFPSNYFPTKKEALTELNRRLNVVKEEMKEREEQLRERGVLL